MSEVDIYDELPDDPEEAFIYLEKNYRQLCENLLEYAGDNERIDTYYVQYISKTISAANELNIKCSFKQKTIPKISGTSYLDYLEFVNEVEQYKTSINIRRARRKSGHSVKLDPAAKVKLRHHLSQIRETVDKFTDVPAEKREAFYKKINALQEEIDRDRTRYEALAALAIEAAGAFGDAVDASKVTKILDSISRVFWSAKQNEPAKRLPAPEQQKLLTSHTESPSYISSDTADDEMSF
jgi:hypothetical protein